ncbi:MAG: Rrf2 family transcriptional regulator [Ignavibacteriales bacterium]|jgi:Rrf2 family protein|nr:Rrf2 family transcriptional regulator [Ignavibacteriales bacterium]
MQSYITREQGYALRILSILAALPKDEQLSIGAMSKRLHISRKFAARIVHKLKHGGLVQTTQGRYGGVQFKGDPRDVTLHQALDVVGFRSVLKECLSRDHDCPLGEDCRYHEYFDELEKGLKESFRSKRISDFVYSAKSYSGLTTPVPR